MRAKGHQVRERTRASKLHSSRLHILYHIMYTYDHQLIDFQPLSTPQPIRTSNGLIA